MQCIENYSHAYNGRIWVIFYKSKVVVTFLVARDLFIHCEVTWLATKITYIITFIYAMNKAVDRRPLWSFLKLQAQSIVRPWAVLSDFNTTLFSNERV